MQYNTLEEATSEFKKEIGEGIKIDNDALKSLSDDLQILIDNYTNEIYKSCGEEFNINSTKQLQEILFNKLGLQSGKKTKRTYPAAKNKKRIRCRQY